MHKLIPTIILLFSFSSLAQDPDFKNQPPVSHVPDDWYLGFDLDWGFSSANIPERTPFPELKGLDFNGPFPSLGFNKTSPILSFGMTAKVRRYFNEEFGLEFGLGVRRRGYEYNDDNERAHSMNDSLPQIDFSAKASYLCLKAPARIHIQIGKRPRIKAILNLGTTLSYNLYTWEKRTLLTDETATSKVVNKSWSDPGLWVSIDGGIGFQFAPTPNFIFGWNVMEMSFGLNYVEVAEHEERYFMWGSRFHFLFTMRK